MAKFEIEAKIGANSAEFESKLKHASKESREFAKNVKENLAQAKDVFGEVAGEAGLGKIVKGLGSASAAAAAFGAAMVASVAEGLKEWTKFEDSARQFGNILKSPERGKEVSEFVEANSGHRGNQEEGNAAMASLLETYDKTEKGVEQAKAKFLELQNAAAETNDSIAGMAESLRRFHAAGEDAAAGGAKLLKTLKPLAGMIEDEKAALIGKLQIDENYFGKNSARGAEDLKQIADLKSESNVDFVKHLTPAKLDEMMTKQYGPKGASGGAADANKDDLSGVLKDLSKVKDQLLQAVGESAAPALKEVLTNLISELPQLTSSAHALGEAFGGILKVIKPVADVVDGVAPEKWGEGFGKWNQQRVLTDQYGMAQLHPNGSPVTPLEKQMNAQYELATHLQRGGTSQKELFGSDTGGKDLQSQQLEAMKKIEANTGVLKNL